MTNLNDLQWYWRLLIFSGVILWLIIIVILFYAAKKYRLRCRQHDHDTEMLRIINKNLRDK